MAAFLQFLDSFRSRRDFDSDTPRSDRPRIGLALSSGGAKGLAHIGVIQVLEENGIEIDAVIGTSMGAYVGGLWTAGFRGDELAELAADLAAPRDLWALIDPLLPPRRGFIAGNRIRKRLEDSLGNRTFADTKIPFYAVATELESLERVVFHEGELVSAVVASAAVPGIVTPVVRHGVEYIDGGVCDPLPVNYLKEHGVVDKVIAVNVLPPVGSLRGSRTPDHHLAPWRRFLRLLNTHLNYFAPGNLLDILRSAAMGTQMRLVERSAKNADVLVRAVTTSPRWHDYNNHRHYIEVGRRAAEEALPAILALYASESEEENSVDIETPTPSSREVRSCA
ncbi:MAG: patatin-like phospholipase family protein [Verrucomicrobiales bacterium]